MTAQPDLPLHLWDDHAQHPAYRDASAEERTRIDQFRRDGVVVLPGAIEGELVERVRRQLAGCRQLWRSDRIQDAWRHRPAVRELAAHPRILAELRRLYGREPLPFQTLGFRVGTSQPAHADDVHFDSIPHGFMCGVWVALEDVGADQGPLRYHPGTHLQPLVELAEARRADGTFCYPTYEELLAQRLEGTTVVDFEARAGDAIVWAAGTVHGGAPVRSVGSTRWSQATHYFFEDCIYVTPMRGDPTTGAHRIREPLVDIRSGRPVPHLRHGRAARLLRVGSGMAHVLEEADRPSALRRATSRARSAAAHLGRRTRAARWAATGRAVRLASWRRTEP